MTAAAEGRRRSSERMAELVESLELTAFQKQVLRQRWVDQIGWTSKRASRARFWYRLTRMPVAIGGVVVPALITILLSAGTDETVPWLFGLPTVVVRLAAFVISLTVAAAAASEEVLNHGEQWRHYRRTAELLKSYGWQFLELSGTFRRHETHAAAFIPFTERVEQILNDDLEGFFGSVTAEPADRTRHEVVA